MDKKVNLIDGDIKKALIKLSIPLTLTAFVTMAYSFVDMIWIGRIGTNAVAAVGVAYFLAWIGQATGLITKIGMGVYAAQAYGRRDEKLTALIMANGFIQAISIALLYTIFVLFLRRSFISFYHLGEVVEAMAMDYLTIIAFGFIFVFLNPVFSQVFHSIGESSLPFTVNTLGLVLNIILDPLFIFGYGPIPALHIKGAAIATVMAQAIVCLIFIFVIKNDRGVVGKTFRSFKLVGKWQKRIFVLGLPAAMISGANAVITIVLNKFMANFGAEPVAVYSIGSELESLSWLTTEGCQTVISSLVAQNYGAGKNKRVVKSMKEGLKLVSMIGLIATFILFFFRNQLFKIFVPNDPKTIILGSAYLTILSASQLAMAIEIGAAGIYNGLSDTRTPATISVSLNLSRIPLSLILIKFFGVFGVWMSMTITSNIKGILSLSLLRKKVNSKLRMDISLEDIIKA